MDVGTQTDPDEDVKWNVILKMLDNIRARDPEGYWDIIIETLFKHFARENRDKRLKEPDIFIEALEAEYWETSSSVPDGLKAEGKWAQEWVEFENYVMLFKEAKACFGHHFECIIIPYILKHKGELYCMHCMNHAEK